jgi:hypothetical protein
MLSTSGLIGTGKKNPELYSTLSKVDRSRTIEGASDFSKFVKTHGPNTRTTSKNSISDRSMSIALDTHGNPVDKKVIVRGCCGNLRAIFGGFRYENQEELLEHFFLQRNKARKSSIMSQAALEKTGTENFKQIFEEIEEEKKQLEQSNSINKIRVKSITG